LRLAGVPHRPGGVAAALESLITSQSKTQKRVPENVLS
jgi:hypothetical protein